jgi:hypothetical protein
VLLEARADPHKAKVASLSGPFELLLIFRVLMVIRDVMSFGVVRLLGLLELSWLFRFLGLFCCHRCDNIITTIAVLSNLIIL